MRVVNKLLDEQKKKKAASAPPAEPDEVEITTEMPALGSINTAASVFDRDSFARRGGINTQPSVFDRSAKFKSAPRD